jgi:hypothetical protein
MNNLSRRDILFLCLGVIFIIYAGYLTLTHFNKGGDTNIATTSLSSPLVKANDRLVINYGGSADPNTDSVIAQYKFFAINSTGLTSSEQSSILTILPAYITAVIPSAFGVTYVHIVSDTVRHLHSTNISFDFYVDSPETYFHYDSSIITGSPVTVIPWEGIK